MSAKEQSSAASGTEVVLFQGDAFGMAEDYASDTLGQTVDDNDIDMANLDDPPALMEVSDDEDDDEVEDGDEEITNMVAELEKSWEPPREGAPGQEAEDNQQNTSNSELQEEELENDDDKGYTQCSTDRFIIGDGYGVKPAVRIRYNDKHPSAWAGQPLMHEESRDLGYGAALGGGDNPWAPFNSKKDWEIVRWAKLQGLGSTAFSDLLAINGVRFSSFFYDFPILQYSDMSI